MKNRTLHIVFLLSVHLVLSQQKQYPFQDPKLDTEKRIDNLLSLMTLDEKFRL
jgi:beta-glucosidase